MGVDRARQCVSPGSRPRRPSRVLGLALRGLRLPRKTALQGAYHDTGPGIPVSNWNLPVSRDPDPCGGEPDAYLPPATGRQGLVGSRAASALRWRLWGWLLGRGGRLQGEAGGMGRTLSLWLILALVVSLEANGAAASDWRKLSARPGHAPRAAEHGGSCTGGTEPAVRPHRPGEPRRLAAAHRRHPQQHGHRLAGRPHGPARVHPPAQVGHRHAEAERGPRRHLGPHRHRARRPPSTTGRGLRGSDPWSARLEGR